MLARYQIIRGKRDPNDPLPDGVRIDIRKHRNHVLSPEPASVDAVLSAGDDAAFARFEHGYLKLLAQRFKADRAPFDELAELAKKEDVFIGCNCPTKQQPVVGHCHTVHALRFMKKTYPKLTVRLPGRE